VTVRAGDILHVAVREAGDPGASMALGLQTGIERALQPR
jgi:hypothetical protein